MHSNLLKISCLVFTADIKLDYSICHGVYNMTITSCIEKKIQLHVYAELSQADLLEIEKQ